MIIKSWQPYIKLMRFDKPIGILLLLWPTLIALWLASDGMPDLKTLMVFTVGVILMRAAGCVINDYADKDFDGHVSRTKQRPLAQQIILPQQALLLFTFLLSLAFILVLQLNLYAIMLSFVAVALAICYPFAKRVTNYPQFVLGCAFAWGIPMAYAQLQHNLPMEAWILFVSTLCWVVAYDTQYAMADKNDDLRIGIKSTAIAFGNYDKVIIISLQLCSLAGFLYIGVQRHLAAIFYISVLVAFALSIYQQSLLKNRVPANCFKAFLNNNYFGAALFLGIFCGL